MTKLKYKIEEIKDFFQYDLINFFRNVWFFRKSLVRHRWYDWGGSVSFLSESIQDIKSGIEKRGNEEIVSRTKKVQKMERLILLLDNLQNDSYIKIAEERLGKKVISNYSFDEIKEEGELNGFYEMVNNVDEETEKVNTEIFNLAREIEISEWSEIWDILKGQDYSKFDPKKDFDEQRDGSGLNTWWN